MSCLAPINIRRGTRTIRSSGPHEAVGGAPDPAGRVERKARSLADVRQILRGRPVADHLVGGAIDQGPVQELVLLSTFTKGGPGGGTFLTPQIFTLNSMIVAADADATERRPDLPPITTGLQVQTVDLSVLFNPYTPPPPP